MSLASVKAPAIESALIRLLANSDPGTRATAADALARSGSETAAEPLLKALSNPDASVQQSAAVALAAIGRPEGGELVDRMLQSGVPDIVLSVAEALPVGDPGRWQAAVTPLLDTENPVDCLRAARVLGKNAPAGRESCGSRRRCRTKTSPCVRKLRGRSSDIPITMKTSPDSRRLLSYL